MSNTGTNPTPTPPTPRLTREDFDKIATAYGRLLDLKDKAIQTPNHEAEVKGIVEFLSEEFLAHAPEFLGVWSAVREEYEPLLNHFAVALERIQAISAQRQALRNKVTTLVQP